ncbi:MAG: DUF2490 domain-containing protein [Labilithrix sp.]|nr:DUF2490 domain-containing protein [Labilithrix sp.]
MRWRLALLALMAALTAPRAARADGEAWFWIENRVPVVRTDTPAFPRLDWRVAADVRFAKRAGGIAQAFLRTGPLLYTTDWMFVGLHGVVYSDRLPTGAHDQEARVEVEPNFFGRVGDFTFNERNRLESRWRDSGHRWRYRKQLRVNYAPKGAKWIPFMWDEILVDLSGLGVNQNRLEFGLARMLSDTTRLDVGYMIRSREDVVGWAHDHILNLYLFIDVVPKKP